MNYTVYIRTCNTSASATVISHKFSLGVEGQQTQDRFQIPKGETTVVLFNFTTELVPADKITLRLQAVSSSTDNYCICDAYVLLPNGTTLNFGMAEGTWKSMMCIQNMAWMWLGVRPFPRPRNTNSALYRIDSCQYGAWRTNILPDFRAFFTCASYDFCAGFCMSGGARHFTANAHFGSCRCFDTQRITSKLPVHSCWGRCPGNNTQYCSTGLYTDVVLDFGLNTGVKYNEVGCFENFESSPILIGKKTSYGPCTNVFTCASKCWGYRYFGVSHSVCRCGNVLQNPKASSLCTDDCQGQSWMHSTRFPRYKCGGAIAMSVFEYNDGFHTFQNLTDKPTTSIPTSPPVTSSPTRYPSTSRPTKNPTQRQTNVHVPCGRGFLAGLTPMNFWDAQVYCESVGVNFHLATILSEQNQVDGACICGMPSGGCWIGAINAVNDKNLVSKFEWMANGQSLNDTFQKWGPGFPNTDRSMKCVEMGVNGTWKNTNCSLLRYPLCGPVGLTTTHLFDFRSGFTQAISPFAQRISPQEFEYSKRMTTCLNHKSVVAVMGLCEYSLIGYRFDISMNSSINLVTSNSIIMSSRIVSSSLVRMRFSYFAICEIERTSSSVWNGTVSVNTSSLQSPSTILFRSISTNACPGGKFEVYYGLIGLATSLMQFSTKVSQRIGGTQNASSLFSLTVQTFSATHPVSVTLSYLIFCASGSDLTASGSFNAQPTQSTRSYTYIPEVRASNRSTCYFHDCRPMGCTKPIVSVALAGLHYGSGFTFRPDFGFQVNKILSYDRFFIVDMNLQFSVKDVILNFIAICPTMKYTKNPTRSPTQFPTPLNLFSVGTSRISTPLPVYTTRNLSYPTILSCSVPQVVVTLAGFRTVGPAWQKRAFNFTANALNARQDVFELGLLLKNDWGAQTVEFQYLGSCERLGNSGRYRFGLQNLTIGTVGYNYGTHYNFPNNTFSISETIATVPKTMCTKLGFFYGIGGIGVTYNDNSCCGMFEILVNVTRHENSSHIWFDGKYTGSSRMAGKLEPSFFDGLIVDYFVFCIYPRRYIASGSIINRPMAVLLHHQHISYQAEGVKVCYFENCNERMVCSNPKIMASLVGWWMEYHTNTDIGVRLYTTEITPYHFRMIIVKDRATHYSHWAALRIRFISFQWLALCEGYSNQTDHPTPSPTVVPSNSPTQSPSSIPTNVPSAVPSYIPSASPTTSPTLSPSVVPTNNPTFLPSALPSFSPTKVPSHVPSLSPSSIPSFTPTKSPTIVPSVSPTSIPSDAPTSFPSTIPTSSPTLNPTNFPSRSPTKSPTTSSSLTGICVEKLVNRKYLNGNYTKNGKIKVNGADVFELDHGNVSIVLTIQNGSIVWGIVRTQSRLSRMLTKTVMVLNPLVWWKASLSKKNPVADFVNNQDGTIFDETNTQINVGMTPGWCVASSKLCVTWSDLQSSNSFQSAAGEYSLSVAKPPMEIVYTHVSRNYYIVLHRQTLRWFLVRSLGSPAMNVSNWLYRWDFSSFSQPYFGANPFANSYDKNIPNGLNIQARCSSAKTFIRNAYNVEVASNTSIALAAILMGGGALITLIGKIHASVKQIENFNATAILFFSFNSLDFVTDVMLGLALFNEPNGRTNPLTLACITFIVVPVGLSLIQFWKANKAWQNDQRIDSVYLDRYLSLVVGGTILSGSVFATVRLLNSNLFGVAIFSIYFSRYHLNEFIMQRVYSQVLFENIPQLVIQLLIVQRRRAFDVITAMALTTTAMSITHALFSALVQQNNNLQKRNFMLLEIVCQDMVDQFSQQKIANKTRTFSKCFVQCGFTKAESETNVYMIKRSRNVILVYAYFHGNEAVDWHYFEDKKKRNQLAQAIQRNFSFVSSLVQLRPGCVKELRQNYGLDDIEPACTCCGYVCIQTEAHIKANEVLELIQMNGQPDRIKYDDNSTANEPEESEEGVFPVRRVTRVV